MPTIRIMLSKFYDCGLNQSEIVKLCSLRWKIAVNYFLDASRLDGRGEITKDSLHNYPHNRIGPIWMELV